MAMKTKHKMFLLLSVVIAAIAILNSLGILYGDMNLTRYSIPAYWLMVYIYWMARCLEDLKDARG